VPSDFHLFIFLKIYMGGKKYQTDEEVKQEVVKLTKDMAGEFYENKMHRTER